MNMIGYAVPDEFGPNRTGENLRRLMRPLGAGKVWRDLTDRQRSYWWEVLGHNQHDCHGMYTVSRRAASELALDRPAP
jgi:hypothetical protein